MHVKALLCEKTFGHSWSELMQLHSPFSTSTTFNEKKLTLRERWNRRHGRPTTLHDRIWSFGELRVSPWLRRAGQARFMADLGWKIGMLAVVALTVWLMGDVGSTYRREEQAWEQWRTSAAIPDENYFYFLPESDEVVAEWWQTLEHQAVLVPETLEGGFT